MLKYSASIDINAKPEKIWAILTDAPQYPAWDPGMLRLEGTIALGQKITAYTKVSPNRAFPVTVTIFEPHSRMVWGSGMPLGLFKGERTFSLDTLENGKVNFSLQEVFTGLMLPLIGRSIPDLNPTFKAFAEALKARAEAG